ncbi:hypothetical protein VTO42DRAFT_6383 [Malbranchea cinnamomea]
MGQRSVDTLAHHAKTEPPSPFLRCVERGHRARLTAIHSSSSSADDDDVRLTPHDYCYSYHCDELTTPVTYCDDDHGSSNASNACHWTGSRSAPFSAPPDLAGHVDLDGQLTAGRASERTTIRSSLPIQPVQTVSRLSALAHKHTAGLPTRSYAGAWLTVGPSYALN